MAYYIKHYKDLTEMEADRRQMEMDRRFKMDRLDVVGGKIRVKYTPIEDILNFKTDFSKLEKEVTEDE